MSYYNRDCKKLDLSTMRYLDSGSSANIYCNSKIIFKKYFNNLDYRDKINIDIFDLLKEIDNPHLIKLYDIYYNMNLLNLLLYKMEITTFNVDGYTGKYYGDDSVKFLNANIDYILENFKELEQLFQTFTNNGILTSDIKNNNTILSSEHIIIIDPDRFSFSSDSQSSIAIHNKKKLLQLFRSLCYYGAKEIEYSYTNYWQIIKKIETEFNSDDAIIVSNKTDITSEISKKLKYVKTPIEYFIKQD